MRRTEVSVELKPLQRTFGSSITAARGNPCAPNDRNTYLDYRHHMRYDGIQVRTKKRRNNTNRESRRVKRQKEE